MPNRSCWVAVGLALLAWALFGVGFAVDDSSRFTLLLLAGVPGLASQIIGLRGARVAQRHGLAGQSADLAWIIGVVPTLPLGFVAALDVVLFVLGLFGLGFGL